MLSQERNSQNTASMMRFASDLSSADSSSSLASTLRVNLPLLGFPGIILCLSPVLASSLNSVNIEIVMPDLPNEFASLLPMKVRSPALFPKRVFSKNKIFSVTLAVLSHNEKYLGYAYIFMKNENPFSTEGLQEVLSQNLYRLFIKEGRTKTS